MAKLLFFGESFPLVLHFRRLVAPLLADDLGYYWIGKTGILGDDLSLMMLAIEDECYGISVRLIY